MNLERLEDMKEYLGRVKTILEDEETKEEYLELEKHRSKLLETLIAEIKTPSFLLGPKREKTVPVDIGGKEVRLSFKVGRLLDVPIKGAKLGTEKFPKDFIVTFDDPKKKDYAIYFKFNVHDPRNGRIKWSSSVSTINPPPFLNAEKKRLETRLKRGILSGADKRILKFLSDMVMPGKIGPPEIEKFTDFVDEQIGDEKARQAEAERKQEFNQFKEEFSQELEGLNMESGEVDLSSLKAKLGELFNMKKEGENWKDKLKEIAERQKGKMVEAEWEEAREEEFSREVSAKLEKIDKEMGINLSNMERELSETLHGKQGWSTILREAIKDTVDAIRSDFKEKHGMDTSGIHPMQLLNAWNSEDFRSLVYRTKEAKSFIARAPFLLLRENLSLEELIERIDPKRSSKDAKVKREFMRRIIEPLKLAGHIEERIEANIQKYTLSDEGKLWVQKSAIKTLPTKFEATHKFTTKLMERLRKRL